MVDKIIRIQKIEWGNVSRVFGIAESGRVYQMFWNTTGKGEKLSSEPTEWGDPIEPPQIAESELATFLESQDQ